MYTSTAAADRTEPKDRNIATQAIGLVVRSSAIQCGEIRAAAPGGEQWQKQSQHVVDAAAAAGELGENAESSRSFQFWFSRVSLYGSSASVTGTFTTTKAKTTANLTTNGDVERVHMDLQLLGEGLSAKDDLNQEVKPRKESGFPELTFLSNFLFGQSELKFFDNKLILIEIKRL